MTLKEQKGFTLVELLLTIALLSIAVGVTTDIILSITKSYNKSEIANELEQNSNFVLLKLEKELRNAQGINEPEDKGDSSSKLDFIDGNRNQVTYEVKNNLLYRDGKLIVNNDSNLGIKVSCPLGSDKCFILLNDSPLVVQLGLRFEQLNSTGGTAFTGSVDLNNTIVLRNSY